MIGGLPHAKVDIIGKLTHGIKGAYNMLPGISLAVKILELGEYTLRGKVSQPPKRNIRAQDTMKIQRLFTSRVLT